LESALAKRSQLLPLQALPALTRDADASPRWRINGWVAIGAALLLAGGLTSQLTVLAHTLLHDVVGHHTATALQSGIGAGLTLAAVILAVYAASFVAEWLAVAGSVLLVVLTVIGVTNTQAAAWQWTSFSALEFSGVVVLALASTGLGLGVYWASAVTATPATAKQPTSGYGAKAKSDTPRRSILPIWIAQLLGGLVVALGWVGMYPDFAGGQIADAASPMPQHLPAIFDLNWALYALALLCAAGFLLGFVRQQLRGRGFAPIIVAVISLAGLALWVLPLTSLLLTITNAVLLIVAAIYAIFSGWKMKSSHLRKALGFNNEALYNVWRVQIRILVPLAVLIALIGLISQLVTQIH
jgi:hypothetical protein